MEIKKEDTKECSNHTAEKEDTEECSNHTAAIKEEDGFNLSKNPQSSLMIFIPEDYLANYGSSSYSSSLQLIKDYQTDDKDDDSSKPVVKEEKQDDILEKKVKIYRCATKEEAEDAEKVEIYTCANKDEVMNIEAEAITSFDFYVDEDITSYGGITIKRSDVDSLKGAYFLSDNVIGFYFSWLDSQYQSNDVFLVSPSISHMLASISPEESAEVVVKPLNLLEKQVLLFPFNDAGGFNGEGLHWSLLVYHKARNAFYHHDSMRGSLHTRRICLLYENLKKLLCPRTERRFCPRTERLFCPPTESLFCPPTESSFYPRTESPFYAFSESRFYPRTGSPFYRRTGMLQCGKKRKNKMGLGMGYLPKIEDEYDEYDAPFEWDHFTPQQTNSTDCGLYVMEFARVICRWYVSEPRNEDELWLKDLKMIDTLDVEYGMRDQIQELIQASKNGVLNLQPPQ